MDIREKLKLRKFDEIRINQAFSFLYSEDEFYRFRGAEALGHLCRGEKAREYILRLFWHLNDESGAYCIGAPLGIAEIGRSNPFQFTGFKNKFVSLLDNWEVERKYVAYGIGRTAEIIKDAYPNPVEKLLEKIEEINDENFVIYAIWALKKLGEDVRRFMNDERIADFYDGEAIVKVRICDIVKQNL